MMEIIVAAGGIVLIGLIIWWFWLSSAKAAHADAGTSIEILVKDGTYQPAAVEVPAGQPLQLDFLRLDATPCAEKVVFNDLAVTVDLPLGQAQTVSLPPLKPGIHEFTCQMGMYRGRLIAK